MTRSLSFTRFEGKLFLRRLPEQPVALMVAEVPAFYDELEALAIIRAVAEAGGLPEGRRVAWNELLGAGLSVGVLTFESSGPSRATGRRFLKRAGGTC